MANWFTNLFTTTQVNRIAPAFPIVKCYGSSNYTKYSGKIFGSYTRFAIALSFDSLQRRNMLGKISPAFNSKEFSYSTFETNVLWLLGIIIDTENANWNPTTTNPKSGAYGYFQILNKDYLKSALTSMKNQIDNYNSISTRDWKLYGTFPKGKINLPFWHDNIMRDVLDPNLSVKDIVDYYAPDMICSLIVSTLAQSKGTDEHFLNLGKNPVDNAKGIYYRGHEGKMAYENHSLKDLVNGVNVDPDVYHNVTNKIICNKKISP